MEGIVSNFINALGWSIVHSFWQGAIIFGVIVVIFNSSRSLSAKVKHDIAFCSVLLMFAVFGFTFLSIAFRNSVGGQLPVEQGNNEAFSRLSNNTGFSATSYFPLIAIVYAIGLAFQTTVLLSSYFKLKKLKRNSITPIPVEWQTIFKMSLFQLKINKQVRFYLSGKVNVPLVIGFFRPVVLFPIALATQLDTKQVEAILIHELSHIKRNDYFINLVKTCVETFMFFNPFIWLTTRLLQIEREHACDDLVLSNTGTPLTYAHALLKLELVKDKSAPALSLAATGNNQYLYQRIKRITNMKTNYIIAKQQIIVIALTIATVASLAWMNPVKKEKASIKVVQTEKMKLTAIADQPINQHLVARADTDTTKVKRHRNKIIITDRSGNQKIYATIDDMPDSLKNATRRTIFLGDSIASFYNSPAWMTEMNKIRENANAISKNFELKTWKNKMAKMELNAAVIEKKFNSQEWKDKMVKMELNALEMEKKFNSPEWKDKMAKMELTALAMEKKFNSPEWKDKMSKMKLNALAMEKKFNSKEWKDQTAKIQKNAEEMQKKFDSPEWKKQMEDLKKLQNSPEYKKLNDKYENDLKELKKKKGILDGNESVGFGVRLEDYNMAKRTTIKPTTAVSGFLPSDLNLVYNPVENIYVKN